MPSRLPRTPNDPIRLPELRDVGGGHLVSEFDPPGAEAPV
jgi:hypothetical protein